MGLTSSKNKGGNVTLVRSSSRCSDGAEGTPLRPNANGKVLPFDPRSPAETFARTPITITSTTANEVATPAAAEVATPAVAVKVLEFDPRSPSQQVSRTPIVVESSRLSSRTCGLKQPDFSTPVASRSATKSPGLSNICTKDISAVEDTDPRSPTVTVPRTPLEHHTFDVSENSNSEVVNKKLLFNQSSSEDNTISNTNENESTNQEEQENEEGAADSEQSRENPSTPSSKQGGIPGKLAAVTKTQTMRTPLGLLQAKQCRTVEEEFNKNQRNILSQFDQSDENVPPVVPSSTQFVEQI